MIQDINCCLTVNKLEDVVVDEVAVAILEQLESLSVVHGALLIINLVGRRREPG